MQKILIPAELELVQGTDKPAVLSSFLKLLGTALRVKFLVDAEVPGAERRARRAANYPIWG